MNLEKMALLTQNFNQLIEIQAYTPELKKLWDDFVFEAKNSHFFFKRDYMEYHSDRFQDHSLLFFKNDRLIALFAANIQDKVLYSHQGLSFGGFISSKKMTAQMMLDCFAALRDYAKENAIEKIIYKAIPYIYHREPASEDLYALFINEAKLYRRDSSATIDMSSKLKFQERRRRMIKKAKAENISLQKSDDLAGFWQILKTNLKTKFDVNPVHSLEEIQLLQSRFPENIKLFTASKSDELLAGTLVYENPNVVHTQYLAASVTGKELGALDLLIDYLVNDYYDDKIRYFDFGISNEQGGKYLNQGLMEQKEGFGARVVCHDFYEL